MEVPWVIWLAAGLLLVGSAAFVSSLEAVLWQTPRARMNEWPRLPRLEKLAADFAHPRDCLFTLFMVTGGMLRALGWWALWLAAVGLAAPTGWPVWVWSPCSR
jgi:hypothetical protein